MKYKIISMLIGLILLLNAFCIKSMCHAKECNVLLNKRYSVSNFDPLSDIKSPSVILIEASTGTVLYEKKADDKRKPASVTKVMTLLLIYEAMDAGKYGLDDMVTISEHAASMGGSQCFFEAGETQRVEDMIKCIIIASGNDAAVAMAEYTAGSETAFVDLMNKRARELGMENTIFANACGLDKDGHLTTARDIAIMSRELTLKHPEIFNYSKIWMDSIIHKTKRGESEFGLTNTNKFINQYTGATGLKTGYTSDARYCICATATRNGIDLIAVIMGAETKDIRNAEVAKILDYGFSVCSLYEDKEGLSVKSTKINNGVKKCVNIGTDSVFKGVLNKNETPDMVEKTIIINKDIKAPVKRGQVLGKISYKVKSRELGEINIVAYEDVDKLTFVYSLKKIFDLQFMIKEK